MLLSERRINKKYTESQDSRIIRLYKIPGK